MLTMDKLKSSLIAGEFSWQTMLPRLIVSLLLLALVMKIGS